MNRQQRRVVAELGRTESDPLGAAAADRLEMGLRHQQAGRLSEAEDCYRLVLASNPDHPDALHLLGVVAYQVGRDEVALALIAQAIRRNAQNPLYFTNLGLALARQGRFDKALASHEQALALKPDYADAHNNRGNALKDLNRRDEALASYDRALALRPAYAEAYNNRGIVLQDARRFEEALASFESALALDAGYPDALYNRGNTLAELRRFEEAVASFDRALALRPGHAETFNNRGNALHALQRSDEALASYRQAVALRPDYAEAFNNRGVVLHELKRFDEAVADYDQAVALLPGCAEVFYNRGNALQAQRRFAEALGSYDSALALRPDHAEAFYHRGNALKELRRVGEALASYDKALALRPDFVEVHWHESYLRLLTGDFERGLTSSQWRWKNAALGLEQRNFPQPLWLGAVPVDGKTVLLHSDQGMGDAIFFCRYVPLLAARGARVVVEVEEPLKALMSGVSGVWTCVSKTETPPDFDLHCPMSGLPLAFETRLMTIPAETPYLRVPAQARDWSARLGLKDRPRIGLVWSGNPRHSNDHNRSIALDALAPLLDVAATFVGLQKDIREADAATLARESRILNLGLELEDFADTAALIAELDLVVSVDTSVVHLAGALGTPVWVLLPFAPDWRWMLDRQDSPWYPTARLFRQGETREWGSVIQRVRDELRDFVENHPAG